MNSLENIRARAAKFAIGGLMATSMLFASVPAAQAFSQDLIDAKLHFLECLYLVFHNPDLHLEECGVGPRGPIASLGFYITGTITPYCSPGYTWNGYSCVHVYP